jgi:hypothetical protein
MGAQLPFVRALLFLVVLGSPALAQDGAGIVASTQAGLIRHMSVLPPGSINPLAHSVPMASS